VTTTGSAATATHEPLRIRTTGEELSLSADLTSLAGLRHFVVRHDVLAPKRRASSAHAHSASEEFIFVLRGKLMLSVDGNVTPLAAGDYAVMPPSEQNHFLFNDSDESAEWLTVASIVEGDVVSYG
jgi:uncharacterized cupin superfamily protein